MVRPFLLMSSVLLVLLLDVWVSPGEASPLKCCTNFSPHSLPLNRLKDFSEQDLTTTCRLRAIIFTTVKDRKICADPQAAWVKNAISHIRSKGEKVPESNNSST